MTTIIAGASRLFAIIGDPIGQVRSPELFNALFQMRGWDAVLVPMQISAEHLDTVLPQLKQIRNLDGIVVTIPHKLNAMRHADRLLSTAQLVGAVNALARQPDGTWSGEMFDGHGFLAGLVAEGCVPFGRRVFIAGAGGVGRAIAFALADAHVSLLTIHDIDHDRATTLAQAVHARYSDLQVSVVGACPFDCDLAVNATPLGMRPDDPLPLDLDRLSVSTWIAEVVMKPEVTRLVAASRARGHPVVLGRRILENQMLAITAFFGMLSQGKHVEA